MLQTEVYPVDASYCVIASSCSLYKESLMACRNLQTSVADVWAAGDICAVRPEEQEPCWFQMRLWTQVLFPSPAVLL